MKKNFFYLAMAAAVSFGLTACSSDENDENEKVYPVTLTLPEGVNDAVELELATPLEAADESHPALKSIDFTENGTVVVELRDMNTGEQTYVTDDATKKGDVYTMSNSNKKVKGNVKMHAKTRASEQDVLVIDISVAVDGETVVFQSGEEGVDATATTNATGDETLDRLCRTWKVDGALLDLKSKSNNIKAYEEFDSDANGYFDLRQVREEAEVQDLDLSEEDKEEFERTVKDIIITKSGKFIIEYTDHESDVADWEWADAQKTTITITMNCEDMGNKFIQDGSRITFAFRDNRCNLKLDTNIDDDSNNDWEVTLTLKLRG